MLCILLFEVHLSWVVNYRYLQSVPVLIYEHLPQHTHTHTIPVYFYVSIWCDDSVRVLPFNVTSAFIFVLYAFVCMFFISHGAQKRGGTEDIGKIK